MAITASSVLPNNSLEDFRIEFNNLVVDVAAIKLVNKFDVSIIFEGDTADEFETTLSVVDPTADRSILLPNVSGNIIVDGNPISADGAALGSATLEWSDLYLADGGVIYFGDDQDIPLTHVADTGLRFDDSDKLMFGAGSDLQIWHDGSNSIISDAGTGSLFIRGSNITLSAGADGAETWATFVDNGAVTLYYDNGEKLATSSTGGTLTGTWNVTTNFVPDASDGAALGTTALEWSDLYLADGAVVGVGDDQDVTLTHVADTGLLLNSTMQLQFNDSSQYISGASATKLDIRATDEIELTSTLVDIVGALTVSGTTTLNGALVLGDAAADTLTVNATLQGASPLTFEGRTADGYETTFAITDPTADRTITFPNLTGTVSLITATETLTNKTLTSPVLNTATVGTSIVPTSADGAALGTTALEWSDLYLADGAVIYFGDDQDVTLTHAADTSLTLNLMMAATTFEPSGDTASGDNAAIGYTSAEGLILTGQGSTSDITLKNDADGTVFTVPTGTDDILFPDNAKAMWGAGSDLQIYHDGSNSYINDAGTGNLKIAANQIDLLGGTDGGETMASFVDNGAVTLYYDNSAVAATADGSLGPTSANGAALGGTSTEWSDLYLHDGAIIYFGADQDVTLTHVADAGLLLNSTMQLQFNDASQYISGASATKMDIRATDEIELTSTLVDIVGALTVSGTTTLNGALVLGDAAADTLTVNATLQGASPLTFEGGTADGYETTFAITAPTADRTITFPNKTMTVAGLDDVTALAIALG